MPFAPIKEQGYHISDQPVVQSPSADVKQPSWHR